MVTHMLWWGFVPCTSQRILGFSWVPATLKLFKNVTLKMLIWVTLWKLLTKAESLLVSAGKWQVKQTFLQQIVSQSFKGSPSEWWCVELHELIASALWCCSLLKILTPYWFPMAFQKRRTLLIHHMRNLWYDIIRSWRQSKSKFQIPLLQNVYLSDLICWQCSNVCNFLHGRLWECEGMAGMKKMSSVGELRAWVFQIDLEKSTQCWH